jgi:hypothetical protein
MEVARKAIRHGTNFYDKCQIKIARMENMNTCQGTVFGRSLLTESTDSLMENGRIPSRQNRKDRIHERR